LFFLAFNISTCWGIGTKLTFAWLVWQLALGDTAKHIMK